MSRTASTWKAHAPTCMAPARQLNQTRRPARDKRRGGWLVTLIIFGLALLPMLFNLSERVFYSLADLGGRSSYAETEAPEASIHAEAPAEDMTGVNPYEGVDWGLPTAGGGFGCHSGAGLLHHRPADP